MTAGPSGDDKDADLDRLTRQYPQWRMWRGRATGDYWAMPPRGHPTARELVSASDIGELAAASPRPRDDMAHDLSAAHATEPIHRTDTLC
jgi:hypothetical protein